MVKKKKVVPILGAAAVAGFAAMAGPASAAGVAPVAKISLGSGVTPVGLMDGYQDLHPPGQTTGFLGKGAGAYPGYGYYAPSRGRHHHRHR
jgi:hypothetical protein